MECIPNVASSSSETLMLRSAWGIVRAVSAMMNVPFHQLWPYRDRYLRYVASTVLGKLATGLLWDCSPWCSAGSLASSSGRVFVPDSGPVGGDGAEPAVGFLDVESPGKYPNAWWSRLEQL